MPDNSIKKSLLRSILKFGIKTINLSHKRGEMNIRQIQKEINAPGGKKVLVEVHKPKLLMGFIVEKGEQISELPLDDLSIYDVKIIVYDGLTFFDLIAGFVILDSVDNYGRYSIKYHYSFLDSWGQRHIDYKGISQKCWISDVNWVGKIFDRVMQEIRNNLKDTLFFKRMLKKGERYEFGKKYYY